MATYAEKLRTNTLTVGEAIALGPKKNIAVLRKNVKKAGVDLDSPWLDIGKGQAGVDFLINLNKVGTEANFTALLTVQNNVATIASVNDLPDVPNVFGANGKARSIKIDAKGNYVEAGGEDLSGLEKASQARETKKFKAVPSAKLSVPIIADGIAAIPDPQTRAAVAILALIPLRPGEVAFGGSTKYPDTQLQVGDIDFETGVIKETVRGGKIRNAIQIPEVALEILRQAEADAVAAGRKNIFDTTVSKMTSAVNAPGGISEKLNAFENRMGRKVEGVKDLRKIIPSIIASELGFTGDISAIMGHDDLASVSKDLAKTTSTHYVSDVFGEVNEATREKVALSALQNEMAKVLGLNHQGELAAKFGIDVPALEKEGSKFLSIVQKDSPVLSGDIQETRVITKEDEALSAAQKNANTERLNLEAEQFRAEAFKLGEATNEAEANFNVENFKSAVRVRLEKADIAKDVTKEFSQEKAQRSAGMFDDFLADMAEEFSSAKKTLKSSALAAAGAAYTAVKTIPGGIADPLISLGEGLLGRGTQPSPPMDGGTYASPVTDPYDIAEMKGAKFARDVGIPESLGKLGAVAGEMVTGAVADPEGAGRSAAQMASLLGMAPRINFQQAADAPAPNIPDPAPPAPDMAAQGFVPVPEATANAKRGEATAMTMARGGQAPSFLYGGVVR